MDKTKKYLTISFIVVLIAVIIISAVGMLLLKKKPVILQGQIESTEIRISGKLPGRIDTFLVHHPYLSRKDVPAEMVTASASGLDPNITPQCAYVQVKRVAQARGLTENQVKEIVDQSVEKPLLGIFGTEKINVLKLNIALEENK